ncbi:MAG: rhamnulose-1-phosphate aldolase [Bacteroidetes bacterium]|nr:rhamnulose-1-phosphate aldolase [Bacteroidota bacterium]MBL6963050.1 rhamnulose-1-phosphate aldolase [Bacteroidota bacterium]
MMLLKQLLEYRLNEIQEIAQIVWDKGWGEGSAGNYSIGLGKIDLKDNYLFHKGKILSLNSSYKSLAEHSLLISARGARMRDVARNAELLTGLLHISKDGMQATYYKHHKQMYDMAPTSEMDVHLALHSLENKQNTRAVLHAHVTEIIAFTHYPEFKQEENINQALINMHPEFAQFIPEGVGYIPFMTTGNLQIAEKTAKTAREKSAIIWSKHGMVCHGENLTTAFDLMDITAKQADIYLKCLQSGFTPGIL